MRPAPLRRQQFVRRLPAGRSQRCPYRTPGRPSPPSSALAVTVPGSPEAIINSMSGASRWWRRAASACPARVERVE